MLRLMPATIADVWSHHAARNLPLAAEEYRLLVSEAMAGRARAVVDDRGVALVLGGALDTGPAAPGHLWFSVVPGLPARCFAAVALLARRVRDEAALCHPAGIACYIADGNRTGERFAAALGFKGGALLSNGTRIWQWAASSTR